VSGHVTEYGGPDQAEVRLLFVTGSTRHDSTNTAMLRTAALTAPGGVTAQLFDGLAGLPAFNPDDDHAPLPAPVADLREQIAACDAVVFCTPEYAGALPGSFKNALDWTVGGGEMYGKPVAWINVAAPGRGGNAQASLDLVLGYLGANILTGACAQLPVARRQVGDDGLIIDDALRADIVLAVQRVADEVPQRPPVEQ